MPIPPDQMDVATALLPKREDEVPVEVRDEAKLCHRTEGNSIILFDFRPYMFEPDQWHEEMIAKFKYVESRGPLAALLDGQLNEVAKLPRPPRSRVIP